MGESTSIEWCDHTFNPWWGCSRISPACVNCYADTWASRWGYEVWRRHGPRRMLSEANWAKPYLWNREVREVGGHEGHVVSAPGRVESVHVRDEGQWRKMPHKPGMQIHPYKPDEPYAHADYEPGQ